MHCSQMKKSGDQVGTVMYMNLVVVTGGKLSRVAINDCAAMYKHWRCWPD